MTNKSDLETIIIPTGRIVTKQTAWWYNNGSYPMRQKLFCIHSISLLAGCNACREVINESNSNNLEV